MLRCGRENHSASCPAKQWKCFNCDRIGHMSAVCCERSKKSNTVEPEGNRSDDDDEEEGYILRKINKVAEMSEAHTVKVQTTNSILR